jgi:hypothetical protein
MSPDESAAQAAPPEPGATAAERLSGEKADQADAAELDAALGVLDEESDEAIKSVSARGSVFLRSPLSAGRDIVIQLGDNRVVVRTNDLTETLDAAARTFVKPGFLPRLTAALDDERIVVLCGHGCGRSTAAGVDLRRREHDPVLRLPSDLETRELVTTVETVCKDHPAVGLIVEDLDSAAFRELAGFELGRLREVLGKEAALVLTAGDVSRTTAADRSLPIVVADAPPDAAEVVEAHACDRELPAERRAELAAAVALLTPPIAPRVGVALVDDAVADPSAGAEDLAAPFVSGVTDDVLTDWFRANRTARELAALLAATVLEGVPLADVDALTDDLERRLIAHASGPQPAAALTFGLADRGWPEGVLRTARREVYSPSGGLRETTVPQLCPPHDRERVLAWIWQELGGRIREPYMSFLRETIHHPSGRVRTGAAIAAGILFVDDQFTAIPELLIPWAAVGGATGCSYAALALGVPAWIGEPSAARALVQKWGTERDVLRRRVAVLAYGGVLGVQDGASAAAMHLWRIGAETPELLRLADRALASLVAAGGGAEAADARASVLGLLAVQVEDGRARNRVFAVVAQIARALTRGNPNARASLEALGDEPDNLRTYAALLARAFDGGKLGMAAARLAFTYLFDGAEAGRLDRAFAEKLIGAMTDAARERGDGKEEILVLRLRRAFNEQKRLRRPRSDITERLIAVLLDRLRRLTEDAR